MFYRGIFYLPNGHEKFNDAFKAHLPLSVHFKVYDTLMKMPKDVYFELVPNHDIRMKVFLGDCPDKDDIGMYFFPRFKKRFALLSLHDLVNQSFNWMELWLSTHWLSLLRWQDG